MTTAIQRADRRISPVFLALVAVMAVSGWAVWSRTIAANTGFAVFLFVVSGWVVSLCLHEYAHARTALHSGDISVGAKGYLTLNPMRYRPVTHQDGYRAQPETCPPWAPGPCTRGRSRT